MKGKRQQKIIEIITQKPVETQDELIGLLRQDGIDATQATISRDIRDLKIRKVPASPGHQKYVYPEDETFRSSTGKAAASYEEILKNSILSCETAGNLIVIHTYSGVAMAAAAAIDHLKLEDIAGCIAGDDTIFVAVRNEKRIEHVLRLLSVPDSGRS